MLWKIILTSLFIVIIISSVSIFANESKKEEKYMCGDNCINISMPLDKIKNLKCSDFIPFPAKKVKHQLKDKRVRYYYHFKPLMSVAMREADINSYFELIFENGVLSEINQYDLKGNFIKKHNKIYCWIE